MKKKKNNLFGNFRKKYKIKNYYELFNMSIMKNILAFN